MEKEKLKVYVVGRATGYACWITDTLVHKMEDADLVLLTGGEDVNPKYYNEKKHPTTSFTERDVNEFKEIEQAIALKKPMIGICRGLQILTVAAGGKLIQNQSNFYSPHLVNSIDSNRQYPATANPNLFEDIGKEINQIVRFSTIKESLSFLKILFEKTPMIVSSAHHQAAYPYDTLIRDVDYKILTYTTGIHSYHQNGDNEEVDLPEEVEIESMLLPKIKAYGIQGHPEWMMHDLSKYSNDFCNLIKVGLEKFKIDIENDKNIFSKSSLYKHFIQDQNFVNNLIMSMSYVKSYLYFLGGIKSILDLDNKQFYILGSDKLVETLSTTLTVYLSLFDTICVQSSTSGFKGRFNKLTELLNNPPKDVSTHILHNLISDYSVDLVEKPSLSSPPSTGYEKWDGASFKSYKTFISDLNMINTAINHPVDVADLPGNNEPGFMVLNQGGLVQQIENPNQIVWVNEGNINQDNVGPIDPFEPEF